MPEPSDANLRAILVVLLRRVGGSVRIENSDLYDAMLSEGRVRTGNFTVHETPDGIEVRLIDDPRPA